jgi:glycogen debranching enzyme
MDKMGNSEQGHNKGIPATPRDGAAIELTGLLKSTLRWLSELNSKGLYRHEGVSARGQQYSLSFKQWDALLQSIFEKYYYVPESATDDHQFRIDTSLVNRRGFYKDSVSSSSRFTDYQMRPNQFIAMVVAPELFTPEHARSALALGEAALLGTLGMRTLDPADWNYRPNYDVADSSSKAVAGGWNYHQGPEWVWCLGYFLRARLIFGEDKPETAKEIRRMLTRQKQHIMSSAWRGMTELCNENGAFCAASNPIQAWSSACLLDVLYDIQQVEAGV